MSWFSMPRTDTGAYGEIAVLAAQALVDLYAAVEARQSRVHAGSPNDPEAGEATVARPRAAVTDIARRLNALKPARQLAGVHADLLRTLRAVPAARRLQQPADVFGEHPRRVIARLEDLRTTAPAVCEQLQGGRISRLLGFLFLGDDPPSEFVLILEGEWAAGCADTAGVDRYIQHAYRRREAPMTSPVETAIIDDAIKHLAFGGYHEMGLIARRRWVAHTLTRLQRPPNSAGAAVGTSPVA